MATLSDDLRVMVRPFSVYAELAGDEEPTRRDVLTKVAMILFVAGAFVSLTTAGRLVAFHVASGFATYVYAPLVQGFAFLVARRVAGARPSPGASTTRALFLHFSGYGPWFAFLLLLAAAPIVAPDAYTTMTFLLRKGVIPFFLLTAIVWGGVLTYASLRAGLALSRGRAALGTAAYYLVYVASVVGYYVAMNQLQPQFPGIP